MLTIDRLDLAWRLAKNMKVLDIGGQKMADCNPRSPFANRYAGIERSASEYRIVDHQQRSSVDYIIDFNKADSIALIRKVLDDYRPEVILCMETLEHINYHFELMNEMARCVDLYGSSVFITIPNNGNWLFNALGWNHDHSIAFFKNIAYRFITRSDLGLYRVIVAPCTQKYLWYWWLAHLLSLLQPFSWGFLITSENFVPNEEMEPIVNTMRAFTTSRFK